MSNVFESVSNWNLKHLESSLLPDRRSWLAKWFLLPYKASKFCVFFPLSILSSSLHFLSRQVVPSKQSPLAFFSENPTWSETSQVPAGINGSVKIGLSSSDIQDSGPHREQFKESNWGAFYRKNAKKIGSLESLPHTLENSEKLIAELKDLGISHWRTSINLMPRLNSSVDPIFLKQYCDHFDKLVRAGIEVTVTLNHFVHPDDFDWKQSDSARRMADFADSVIDDLYRVGIRKVLVTNEQAVFAFMSHVMGKFPPHRLFDMAGAALIMENQLRAQLETYTRIKKRFPDVEIGLTHDPIRYHNYHKANPLFTPLEKILCHYLTELSNTSMLRFFHTGKFSLKVPFFVNHTFEIPEFAKASTRPLDFIGIQYYADPLIHIYKGSVSRIKGEKLSTYKYRVFPEGIASCLDEFRDLGVPIDITEVGIDIGINELDDEARIVFFDRIFQSVQKAIDCGVNVRSLFFWTKGKCWEWAEGMNIDFSFSDEKGMRGSARWLKAKLAESLKK
jgi:beta-glucosidase